MYVSVAITFMTVRSLVFSHFHSALLFILLNYVSYILFVLIDIDSIMVYTSGVHDHNPRELANSKGTWIMDNKFWKTMYLFNMYLLF